MTDILIKGLEMPKKGEPCINLKIYSDGTVHEIGMYSGEIIPNKATAIELPLHEHLTEKSAFWDMLHEICVKCNDSGDINRYPNRCVWCKIKEAYEKVYQTPTVLEAST